MDRWAALRTQLVDHACRDAAETASRDEMLAALDAGLRVSREPTIHFTASAFVMSSAGVLLHRHRKLDRWLQPGGHIDEGELPWVAAHRECHEETGIDAASTWSSDNALPPVVHVDVHDAGPHRHLDLRYLFTSEPVPPDPSARGESGSGVGES